MSIPFPNNVPPEHVLFRDPDDPECGITLVGGSEGTMTIFGPYLDRTWSRAIRHLVAQRERALEAIDADDFWVKCRCSDCRDWANSHAVNEFASMSKLKERILR